MPDGQSELPLFSHISAEAAQPGLAAIRPDSSLSAAIQVWGESLEDSGKSLHTVKAFTADLRLLGRFVGSGQPLGAIGTHDLRNFLEWMTSRRKAPCSPKTYARRVTSIKAFFRWLTEFGVLDSDPAGPVPQQSVLSPLPEVLTQDETQRVMRTAGGLRAGDRPDSRPYLLISLLLGTGIKKSECLAIHLNHLDIIHPSGPTLFVRYASVRQRYRERRLALPEGWAAAYHEYLAQYAPGERLFPYSPRRLEYLLEEAGQAAGLDKHLSFNMCRWTYALLRYLEGDDRDRIRQNLGISKIQWREVGNKLDRLAIQA
jgi:site-specific recombinase XerD